MKSEFDRIRGFVTAQMSDDKMEGAPPSADAWLPAEPPRKTEMPPVVSPAPDPEPTDAEQIELANSRLRADEAICLLKKCGEIKAEENLAPHNLQPSSNGERWQDNGSLAGGDTVDLFASVWKESRASAARRIIAFLAEVGDGVLSEYCQDDNDPTSRWTFPIECLPAPLRAMAKEISRIEGVPDSLSATCVIAAASGCMGKGIVIPSKSGKITTPNLFTLVAAESGDGKSSTDGWAVAPIEKFEMAEHAKFNKHATTLKARLALAERDIKELNQRKLGSKANRANYVRKLAKAEAEKNSLTEQLAPPCFTTSNATSQALCDLMSRNNGTMMSHASDARGVIAIILGRHEKDRNQTDDEFYLAAYTVTETCRVHRISRPPVIIARPCLAVFWLIQDDMFDLLWDRKALTHGGFLPRFLTCRVTTEPQYVARAITTFSEAVADAYENRLTELLSIYRMNKAQPFTAPVTDEARTVIFDYADRIVKRQLDGEFSAVEKRFIKRWAENAWRMALVLHGAAFGGQAHLTPVSRETARAAVAIVSWFAVQQMDILRQRQKSAEGDKETAVMALVSRHGRVNIRSLKKAGICADDAEAKKLLSRLVSEYLLEAHDHAGRGPATVYYVRPSNMTR